MWSTGGHRVLFWRGEGINDVDSAFYAWEPATGNVTTVLRLGDDELRLCAEAADDRLVCVRETASSPAHVIAIDFRDGSLKTISDINPEFRNIRLGRVERFEWDTPKFAWNEPGGALAGLYPKRAYGFIITPPDFDPSKQYPVFIDPYVAHGFNPLGAEHALHVYAANGFVVLRTAFPLPQRQVGMKQMYSEKLGFPHLSMLMESTVRGLDAAAARAFIDEKRVGVGGVSHGTFVPLFMMQKHDRIAAISISSPTWGPIQSFGGTRKGREALAKFTDAANYDWTPKPFSDGARAFWRQIDIAEHVDKIEAPILMNLAASETFTLLPLIRQLSDGRLPYDAYVFTGETHIKWQPAHLRHIMQRNLDWFRFWLQDREDNDPAKGEQYVRWRELRKLQCANPRTLIANCGP
jgi:dipeptidyl aminopeptidase/acylaminoacyl peptidase